MKTLAFGQKLQTGGDMYLRVKQTGDQIQFRIGQNPVFSGKHFMQTEQGWDVTPCPRINDLDKCEMCDTFFKGLAEAKKLEEAGKKQEADDYKKQAQKFSATVHYYFPVLDRTTGKFGILQTSSGVRNTINAQHEAGVNVMAKDWVLRNTGKKGKDLYTIITLDSADVKPLTPEEEAELRKAEDYDTSLISDGATQSDEIA